MRRYRKPRPGTWIVLIAASFGLLLATGALAARPTSGKTYSGYTSSPKFNGFSAPVSFKVSSSASKLLSFKYGNTGCPAAGPTPSGNPYLKSANLQIVASIPVSSTGTFSIKNAKTTRTTKGTSFYTITSVTGTFKSAQSASGSITYTNGFSAPGFTHQCGTPTMVTFTATAK